MYEFSKEEKTDPNLRGSIEEGFNSQTFKNIRKKMIKGEYVAGCYKCYNEEKAGYRSYGRFFTETRHFQPDIIKGVDIAISRECNLACRMCNGTFSTKWDDVEQKLYPEKKFHYPEVQLEDIVSKEKTYRDIDEWKIVGGEPFMNNSFYKLLEKIKHLDLSEKTLYINTNCTFFPKPKYIKILLNTKRLHITISIDGTGNLNEYIRVYSKWPQVNETAKLWSELASNNSSVHIHSLTTVSAYNIHNLYQVFKWSQQKNIAFHFHILYGPSHLRLWTLPENLRKKIYENYLNYPDFQDNLLKLKNHLLKKQEGDIKDFLSFTDKLDKIHGQDFFKVNTFYKRKDLLAVA